MTLHIKQTLHKFLYTTPSWKKKLIAEWDTIMGNMSEHVCLVHVTKNTVTIGVYEPSWLQELYLLTPVLLATINEHLDAPRITHLRFKAVARKQMTTTEPVPKKCKPQKPITLSPQEMAALETIADEQLRSVLKAFRIKCNRERP